MIITNRTLNRRTLLHGIGAAIALPALDSMIPALGAAPKSPTRLGFVYHPTGAIMQQWTPAGEGAIQFSQTLRDMEPFRDHINIFTGLSQVQGRALGDGPGDHAREGATFLTGVHPFKTGGANIHCGISVDQIAARELGKYTQLASLEIGLESPNLAGSCDSGYSCAYSNTLCWSGPKTPLPMETSPRAVFERLFGDGDSSDPKARLARLAEQRSILDYAAGSIDRMETRLGARDRGKLTEYLDAVRDIERRIQKAEEQSATMELPVLDRPVAAPATFEEQTKLMMDMIVVAYQTDLTRVITYMVGQGGSNRPYPAIGIPDGHHSLSHHKNDPEIMAKVAKIDAYLVHHFTYLLERMKNTPDGDGSLLDHSLILYGSSLGDGNIHEHHNLPIMIAGSGSGQMKTGRHLRYPKETPLNNLFLSLLDMAGVPKAQSFGDATGRLSNV
jgi:hypothetical protein